MSSVTARINSIKQPYGGYIKPSQFEVTILDDGAVLDSNENIHPNVVGMAVDYLTRFCIGKDKAEAFRISLQGAELAENIGVKNSVSIANNFLKGVKGLDDESVLNACKLVSYDVWYRNPLGAFMAKTYQDINPDKTTINNIQILVRRGIYFFETYGPVTKDGFTFEPENGTVKDYEKMIQTGKGAFGGYTATVNTGDGDFLTSDTLWDFKVSKAKPTSKHTLQLLMYWIMGQHSKQDFFKKITKLGIFNPRLNSVYILDMHCINQDLIKTVERDVICYE